MKAKNLIKLLQNVDPDMDVTFRVGRNYIDRERHAKAEVVHSCFLYNLEAVELNIDFDENEDDPYFAEVVLENKEENFIENAKDFDKYYERK